MAPNNLGVYKKAWCEKITFFKRLKLQLEISGIRDIEKYIGMPMNNKIPTHIGDGINFRPKNYGQLLFRLQGRKYARDDRKTLCGAVAAAATKGDGYRSLPKPGIRGGQPSVHFNISATKCNIHLDTHGFLLVDQFGRAYYGPDGTKHIIDELLLPMLGTRRFNSIVPYSGNNYAPNVGLSFVIRDKKRLDSSTSLRITLDAQVSLSEVRSLVQSTSFSKLAETIMRCWNLFVRNFH